MSVVFDSLLIVATIVCGCFALCPCFVLQYIVSFLVLQSSGWGRESWLLKIAFRYHVTVSALHLFLMVQLVDYGISWPYSTYFFHMILLS